MKEQSSEEIARRQARHHVIRKWLTIAAPASVILAIVLIIFVDSRAIVLGFTFIVLATLLVIFTIGAGNSNKRKRRIIRDYSVRTIRPGEGYGQQEKKTPSNPYTTTEGYEALKDAYHEQQIVVVQQQAGDDQKKQQAKKQSQLGAEISNTALVALMVAAVIVMWLFA